jgi:cobalt-zinc-cadmium efflux system protein
MIAIGAIIWEAVGRFSAPKAVDSGTVMIVAGVGVIINGITAWLFFAGRKDDLNIKGAFLHMAADAAVSAGVVIGGLIILQTGSYWIDPVLSIIIAVVIFISTWNLLRDSFNLAIDAVPPEIDQRRVYEYFNNLKEVTGVHDLHIWAMSTTDTALTVHLVIPGDIEVDSFLNKINIELHDSFGIEHPTIQIEKKTDNDCIELHYSSV